MRFTISLFVLFTPLFLFFSCKNEVTTKNKSDIKKVETELPTKIEKEEEPFFNYSILSNDRSEIKIISQDLNIDWNQDIYLKNDRNDTLVYIKELPDHSLSINGHIFHKKKLFYYCLDSIDEPERVKAGFGAEIDGNAIFNAFLFEHRSSQYLALIGQNWTYCRSLPQYFMLFFRMNKKIPTYIFSKRQSCITLNCFNDFDHDGILDYADWNMGDSLLKSYKIKDDLSMVLDTSHYVMIVPDTIQNSFRYVIKRKKWF